MLFHDIPRSQGVANAIKRAHQFIDLTYTPVDFMPCSTGIINDKHESVRYSSYFKPWYPKTGVIYSSCRVVEKYVGQNVSFETFMTAVRNPRSVMYTRNLTGSGGKNVANWYGSVCSAFAGYALQLPYRMSCSEWPDIKGVTKLEYDSYDEFRLCDIVLSSGHIALITDLVRDENGHVVSIEISECTTPNVRSLCYTPEAFTHAWMEHDYVMYRADWLDSITYTPSPFVRLFGDPELPMPQISTALMPNMGNKANYIRLRDEEKAELDILEEGWEKVEVTEPDGCKKLYDIVDDTVYPSMDKCGIHTACCIKGDEKSVPVSFCITGLEVHTDKTEYAVGEEIRISWNNPLPDEVFVFIVNQEDNYVRDKGLFTEEQKNARCAVLKGIKSTGKNWVTVVAKNEYGCYCSNKVYFEVK